MTTVENIVSLLLIPILPSLAILIGLYLQKLIQNAKADLKLSETSQVALRIDEATQAVMDAIQFTTQTYVDVMKGKDAFDMAAQRQALLLTTQKAKLLMSETAQQTVTDVSGDLDLWVKIMIESKIAELKESLPVPAIVTFSNECITPDPEN